MGLPDLSVLKLLNNCCLLCFYLAANPEAPGSIPGAARFSEEQWVWNGVHSALVKINEELLERKVAAPV
jgi:hypothetical protein